MLSLKIIFHFCERTVIWRKLQITKQLNLNESSPKKKDEERANTHVVLYYK